MTRLKGNAVIGQSGGPTCVINQSLVGAVVEARRHPEIQGFYGALHGLQGILDENFVDLTRESPETLERVSVTPSAALGSVRLKPTEEDWEAALQILRLYDIRYLFYIGGNDTAETAQIVQSLANRSGYEFRVCHVPKTIDNDLLVTDHCPGYGSAARFVALAHAGDDLDNRALGGVKINIVMGRHAGFLTAAAALCRLEDTDGPHLIYVPEEPFDLERFAADVDACLVKHGRCVVAVSEGITSSDGSPVFTLDEQDAHGNVQLSGSGALGDLLANHVRTTLRVRRVRADTLGYLQRSFPTVVSAVDAKEAREVGAYAVRSMVTGDADSGSVAIRRLPGTTGYASEYFLTPLETVAGGTRTLPSEFRLPTSPGVTRAFVDYALPLLGDLPEMGRLHLHRIPPRPKS